MRFLTTPLLGFLLLLLASCNNDPTSTVSNEQAGDTQQPSHEDTHGHAHEDAHGHTPPGHAPDGHADPPQAADHELVELASGPANPISIGDKVPNFEVTIDDKKWTLSQLRKNTKLSKDGTIVLTFWCSFCHSCRDIDRDLNETSQALQGESRHYCPRRQ